MIPPGRRLGEVLELIEERKFFTLTAGRQTGKTTSLLWLERHIEEAGSARALWVDLEMAREEPDPALAFRVVLELIDRRCALRYPDLARPSPSDVSAWLEVPRTAVNMYLSALSSQGDKPWVFLFDEADCLVGMAMVSFLTQLRQGYIERTSAPFPASVVLVGQRRVRDYALREEDRRSLAWLGTSSPFNITAEPKTLTPFTAAEVEELLAQHTAVTGQRFEPEAVARTFELTQGHAWLVNALADQIVRRDVPDRATPITSEHVDAAKEVIILERRSHIDSLLAKLREPRLRRILEPMLVGERATDDIIDDDFAYAVDLGLISARGGRYEIANPIYREVLPRVLSHGQQMQVENEPAWYVGDNGALDMRKLMADWQEFWREHGHLAAEGFSYREAGPHLMLMAFLQRVINGGGRIDREYGLGRGALDLVVFWKGERHVIEVKVRRDKRTEGKGIEQLTRYLEGAGLEEGWLVIFDRRKSGGWGKKLFSREVEHQGKRIFVVGC